MENQKTWLTMKPEDLKLAEERLLNPEWRLNNLYHIIDKQGVKRLFKLNWAQTELYKGLWYCNVVLKARQLGISTFACLLFLDRTLFNSNLTAGIIAHTREDAQHMFKRIKHAYDCLPDPIKALRPAKIDSAQELVFSNGSSLRVGTSMRGSTLNYLHVSEFGKICARYPEKAAEVITGSLNTLAPGQYCIIESTAEGREGAFYEMCRKAQAMRDKKEKLNQMDFKFFFFPWHKDPTYTLRERVYYSLEQEQYFEKLKLMGIKLTQDQRNWYAAKQGSQGEDMLREYPSYPEEAFLASSEALFYAKQINEAYDQKRIGHIPHDPRLETFTAWDLGFSDLTAIWFFQLYGKEVRLIDYIEGCGRSLTDYIAEVKRKPYLYKAHYAPHDIAVNEYSTGMSRVEVARNLGLEFITAPWVLVPEGIDALRSIFPRLWIDERKCAAGISALSNYKRKWNSTAGHWSKEPLHDASSHGADAARIMAVCLSLAEAPVYDVDRMQREALGLTNHGGFFDGNSQPMGGGQIYGGF